MKNSDVITKRDIANILFRNKKQIFIVIITAFIVATLGSYMWPEKYIAESKILVELGREIIPPTFGSGQTVLTVTKREEDIYSEIEILKSSYLISKVVKTMEADFNREKTPVTFVEKIKFNIKRAVKWLSNRIKDGLVFIGLTKELSPTEKLILKVKKKLEINSAKLADVIVINFAWKKADLAAEFVKNFVAEYMDYHLDIHRSNKTLSFFKEQADRLKLKLTDSEAKLNNFKKKHNLIQLEQEKILLLRQADSFEASTKILTSEAQEAKSLIQSLDATILDTPDTIVLAKEEERSPMVLSQLHRKLADLKLKKQDALSRYFKESPTVKNIQAELKSIQKLVDEEETHTYGTVRSGVNSNWLAMRLDLIKAKVRFDALSAKIESDKSAFIFYRNRLKRLRDIESEYLNMVQQTEIDRKNYLLYETHKEESRIADAMDRKKLSNVKIIGPVEIPIKPVSPKKILCIILSLFAGTAGGVALTFFTEYMDSSIRSPYDIERMGIPLLGVILERK